MIYILAAGLNNTSLTSQSMSHLWALGFGKVTAESLIHFSLPQGAFNGSYYPVCQLPTSSFINPLPHL